MPNRASLRQDSGPLSPRTPGRTASAGSRTPSITSSPVVEARSDILCLISTAENPAVSVGTTKPRTPAGSSPVASACAQTTATSATGPLVIHILRPVSTQSPPSRRARVCMSPGSEPRSGSVSPKQPTAVPAAIRGSHSCRCSSEP